MTIHSSAIRMPGHLEVKRRQHIENPYYAPSANDLEDSCVPSPITICQGTSQTTRTVVFVNKEAP